MNRSETEEPPDTSSSPTEQRLTCHLLLVLQDTQTEKILLQFFKNLSSLSVSTEIVGSFEAALEALASNEFNACLIDPILSGNKGPEFISEARSRDPALPIIILIGEVPTALDIESIHAGAADYLNRHQLAQHQIELSLRYVMNRGLREKRLYWNVAAQKIIKEIAVELASQPPPDQATMLENLLQKAAMLYHANAIILLSAGKVRALWSKNVLEQNEKLRITSSLQDCWDPLLQSMTTKAFITQELDKELNATLDQIEGWNRVGENKEWLACASGKDSLSATLLITFSTQHLLVGEPERIRSLRELCDVFRANIERADAEMALRRSKREYKDVVENLGEGLMLCDLEESILQVNSRLTELIGLSASEMIGKKSYEVLLPPDEQAQIKERLLARHRGTAECYEIQALRADGSRFWCEVRAKPVYDDQGVLVGSVGALADITENKIALEETSRLQRELLQSQKLKAVGEIAGGIANEINNCLSAIDSNLQLLGLPDQMPEQSKQAVRKAQFQCENAATILNRLIEFSQPSRGVPTLCSPTSLVSDCIKFLNSFLGPAIELVHESTQDNSLIEIDPTQFRQILVSAILATRDALPKGGQVIISHSQRSLTRVSLLANQSSLIVLRQSTNLDVPTSDTFHYPESSQYSVIIIEYTSSRLSASQLQRLMLPRLGEGQEVRDASMALSSLSSIMLGLGGLVDINSLPNKGTRIELSFPVFIPKQSQQDSMNNSTALENRNDDNKCKSGNKVLVVDDEEMLVQLLERFLDMSKVESIGYSDPEAALSWFTHNYQDIGLVIMDLKMSRMDGRECFEKMRCIDPKVRVGFLSGFIEQNVEEDLLRRGALRFFQKPLRYPELVEWVKFAIAPSSS